MMKMRVCFFNMLRTLFPALLLPLFCFGQNGKGAFVDLQKVLQSLPETKVAQDKMDSSISYLKKVHLVLEDSVRYVKLMVPHDGPMNTDAKLNYETRLKKVQTELTDFEKEAHDGLNAFREKLFAPLLETAKKLSVVVAQAYHYSVLVEKNKRDKVLYTTAQLTDITDIVVSEIKKHSKK
jgi:Skp family chaperone for outer membrane proteins